MKLYDVFISYRRSDGLKEAEALYRYLTDKGLRVFFDKYEMIDGYYFTTQIKNNLLMAPNYVFLATPKALAFYEGEDWVRTEIEIAIEEYEKNPSERTVTVLTPEKTVFPDKVDLDKSIRNIADAQRIELPFGEDHKEEYTRVLKSVTHINRSNIWYAAHRWLENSKKPGGRFATLNINETILPNAIKNKTNFDFPTNVYQKDEIKHQPLFEALKSTTGHLYLIGQGGIGKTTALMHIMNLSYLNTEYSENTQIPVFVELSFAPDTYGALYEGGKSSFIRRSIYKQVRTDKTIKQISDVQINKVDEVFNLPYDVAVEPITDILSKVSPTPEYLLLLDGLNEVSPSVIEEIGMSVMQLIMQEINMLISECLNVRIILTSRSDDSALYNASITRFYLSEISDDTVQEYLKDAEIPDEKIAHLFEKKDLLKTLQVPLFLTMYASLTDKENIASQGEILRYFFNERRRKSDIYTAQNRLNTIENNVTISASAIQKKRITADMQNFILDFILPQIAWQMERNGEFYLRIRDIKKLIEPVLTDTDDTAVCGDFGKEIFFKYTTTSSKMHTKKIAKMIIDRLGDDIEEITENIVDCCVMSLGIIQESNRRYGFVHQNIRDYFAAVKNINTIRLSVYLFEKGEKELALECMNNVFKDEPVSYTVCKFIGEYLGEHHNKPFYANGQWNYGVPTEKCDRSLVKRAFGIYKGYFDGECGYGIYSLIETIKNSYTDLSGFDFSQLDITLCSLNGTRLERNKLTACFFNTKVNDTVFLNNIGKFNVEKIVYDNNGRHMFIMCSDGFVRILDAKTLKMIEKIEIGENNDFDNKLFVSSDNEKLIVFIKGKCIQVWNIATLELISLISSNKNGMIDADYNSVKDFLIVIESGRIKLWSLQNQFLLGEFKDDSIREAVLSKNGDYIYLTHFHDDELSIISSDSFHLVKKIKIGFVKSLLALSNDSVIIFNGSSIEIIDIIKNDILFEISEHTSNKNYLGSFSIGAISISPDGNYILVGSREIYNRTVIWNIPKKKYVGELLDAANFPKYMTFNSDGSEIVTITWSGKIMLWDSRTLTLKAKFNAVNYGSKAIGYSSDGKMVSFASKDNVLHVFDIDFHSCIGNVDIDKISAITYSYDKRLIFVGTETGSVKIIEAQTLELLESVCYNMGCVNSIKISTDKKYIVVCFDKATLLFDNEMLINPFAIYKIDSIYRMTYAELSPDNKMLITSQHDGAYIWDVKSQQIIYHIKRIFDFNNYALFAPDGKTIATFTDDNGVDIWDIKNMKNIERFDDDFFVVNHIAYDKKGKYLAVVSSSNCVEIRDAHTYKLLEILKTDHPGVYVVEFVGNDKYIIAESSNNELKIWETISYDCVETFKMVSGLMIYSVDLSHLHPHSSLDDAQKSILQKYGAIID